MHLVLAVPGWKLSPLHAQSRELLMMRCLERGIDLSIMPEFSSGIDLARNLTVAKFLQLPDARPSDVLGFIDSDIAFDPQSVLAILDAQLPVCGGLYPKKIVDFKAVREAAAQGVADEELRYHAGQFCGGAEPGVRRTHTSHDGRDRFIEADKLGTGFLFIRREALHKFIDYHGARIRYTGLWEPKGEQHLVFFSELVGPRQRARDALLKAASQFKRHAISNGELVTAACRYADAVKDEAPLDVYQTEDFSFTVRAKEAGIGCWMYLDANLAHQGTWVFEGSMAKMLAAKEAAQAREQAAQ